jgi:MFS family permease
VWSAAIGAGTGLRWIVVDSWVADLTPPDRRGRVLSIGEMVTGLGFALGPALAAAAASARLPGGPELAAACLVGGAALLLVGLTAPVRPASAHRTGTGGIRIGGLPTGAALVLLLSAGLGGMDESGFAGVATLLSAADGARPAGSLATAAAVGAGSFVFQYFLGVAADRHGGCVVLMACTALLAAAFAALALAPAVLPLASFVIGGVGGGLYTVAVVFGLQSAAPGMRSAPMISMAALAYTTGTLVAPSLAGFGLGALGVTGTVLVFAGLAVALLAWITAVRAWRWVDIAADTGPTCAYRFSPTAAERA